MQIYKIVALPLVWMLCGAVTAQYTPISLARTQPLGTAITVRGIVTNGDELGKIRYVQDGTAGIAAFPGAGSITGFDTNVKIGDSIEVTGTLVSFQSLLEISPITSYTILSSNQPLPAPKIVNLNALSNAFESQLVRIECTQFTDGNGAFASSGTYNIIDGDGGQSKVYLRGGHPMLGSAIPSGAVRLTGVLGRFGDFQVLPRFQSDLVQTPCFFVKEGLQQTAITTTSFDLTWQTNLSANAVVQYGLEPNQLTQVVVPAASGASYMASFTALQPGTIYWAQAIAVHSGDTARTDVVPFATQSLSSGQIQVYFNHSINPQLIGNQQPSGQTPESCINSIVQRINAAEQTIDVAMYNVNLDVFIQALKAAHTRGVRVRYIAAAETFNASLSPNPPFPVLYGNDIALMHNKFMVIDPNQPAKAWVMSGSLNWTEGNTYNDFNNLLWIQDQSLARGYQIEFEEMWGGSGSQPVAASSKFGNSKRNNTPHQYIIGGHQVESYFSPSDQVSAALGQTLQSAQSSIELALLTFTYNDLGDILVKLHTDENIPIRGMIENENELGTEYDYLISFGIELTPHTAQYDLHHKYAVIDALQENQDPLVLTGSHNWSEAAESQNDENTLIIHNADIARLYLAEFEQRLLENTVSVQDFTQVQTRLYPNPTDDYFMIQQTNWQQNSGATQVEIWTVTGRLIQTSTVQSHARVSVQDLPAGNYIVKIYNANGFSALPLQKVSR